MGPFDDIEARGSPTRFSSMLGRGVGEARRRIALIVFLAFFLVLALVAFRRQGSIKDIVSSTYHRSKSTISAAPPTTESDLYLSTNPDVNSGSKSDAKPDSKSDSKSTSRLNPAPGSSKGPVLATANGDRSLAPGHLQDLHNRSLGVSRSQSSINDKLILNRMLYHSSRKSSSSMCLEEAISSMR